MGDADPASTTPARRRFLVACALTAGSTACSIAPPRGVDERIVQTASGRTVGRNDLLVALKGVPWVLLGEVHDNPWHHRYRAALLADLSPRTVVAEPLPRGARVGEGEGGDVLVRLEAAGFESRAWEWPLHRPVFEQALAGGATLVGGNAAASLVRQVARQGPAALPPDLKSVLDAAPLDPQAQSALEGDLLDGHCGKLPAERMPNMRWAQRARDASMLIALRMAATPAILLAGNGHVRRDYGVPQLLGPDARRALSVGFVEAEGPVDGRAFDYVWITPRASREDPCGRL